MEYVGYLASFAMGIVLGLVGGGGSILTVPILVYLFSQSPMTATAYSLFVVGATALVGSFMYVRKGDVDFQAGIAFALPSVLGVNISRGIVIPQIPAVIANFGSVVLTKEILVMMAFAALMVAASYSMLRKKNKERSMTVAPVVRMALISIQGMVVGAVAGFVGAGGGFLIIPALVFMAGLEMRVAIGTSLLIIAFQSLLGFAGDIFRGLTVAWSLLIPVMVFAVVGIVVGSSVAHKIEERRLKTAFGWFVLLMGFSILVEQFNRMR